MAKSFPPTNLPAQALFRKTAPPAFPPPTPSSRAKLPGQNASKRKGRPQSGRNPLGPPKFRPARRAARSSLWAFSMARGGTFRTGERKSQPTLSPVVESRPPLRVLPRATTFFWAMMEKTSFTSLPRPRRSPCPFLACFWAWLFQSPASKFEKSPTKTKHHGSKNSKKPKVFFGRPPSFFIPLLLPFSPRNSAPDKESTIEKAPPIFLGKSPPRKIPGPPGLRFSPPTSAPMDFPKRGK